MELGRGCSDRQLTCPRKADGEWRNGDGGRKAITVPHTQDLGRVLTTALPPRLVLPCQGRAECTWPVALSFSRSYSNSWHR